MPDANFFLEGSVGRLVQSLPRKRHKAKEAWSFGSHRQEKLQFTNESEW
jgi:hypothetical protein